MSPESLDRFLPLTPATFHILLSFVEGVHHGYGVKRVVEERTEGAVRLSAGTLYTAVQRLEEKGMIEEVEAPEAGEGAGSSRWRFYRATGLGRDVARAELDRLVADVKAARAAFSGNAGA